MNKKNSHYLLGIDVGTGSVRAGIFTRNGTLISSGSHPIMLYREAGNIVEQSSEEIWQAVRKALHSAIKKADIDAEQIVGIGFDATCSLVVLGDQGKPLPVGNACFPERNIMLWMDQRALEQAERINSKGHRVLDYVGGRISPEMETPKLLWLKENKADVFNQAWQFMDLTDFLTWRATGDCSRSICTVTCKWTYMAHEASWDPSYFAAIGLKELADEGFKRIGTRIVPAGVALGSGLTEAAAKELGLKVGTPVAAGLIDAHAGGIGSIGSKNGGGATSNLAYVFGTSSCTMTSTPTPIFAPGIWGPYYSAMVPGLWLNEGGQSAAGAAIDQLLALHPYTATAQQAASSAEESLPDWLINQVKKQLGSSLDCAQLAKGQHILPEFLGNRAPHADPHTRAIITGLGMHNDLNSLISLYIAGLCGIGYGLRQIIEAQGRAGAQIERIVISGGAGRHPLVRQLLADTTGIEVAAPSSEEPVLLGSAILGSIAAGIYKDIPIAMDAMSSFSNRFQPQTGDIQALHQQRFAIFNQLQAIARQSINC